ncbi:MAG: hypothetical protein ACC653_13570, partial [Gammaproteobacteria bacterium]
MPRYLQNPVELLGENTTKESVTLKCNDAGRLITINDFTHKSEDGLAFFSGYYWDENDLIPNNGIRYILLQNITNVSFSGIVHGEGDIEVDFFYNCTFSDQGIVHNFYNYNFISSNLTQNISTHDPVITDEGQLISRNIMFGGERNSISGFIQKSNNDYIFPSGSNALFKISNKASTAIRLKYS